MTRIPPKHEPSRWTPDDVRDISEAVYKVRLEATSKPAGAVARMIANDKDNGEKLRNRAGDYDALTRAYLDVLDDRLDQAGHVEDGERMT